jgi:phosphopantothenoylcysteine synthetase/decarboxylase
VNVLVTAGNTLAPIDRVRAVTNVFTGRTGAAVAAEARRRGHAVTLATSHPDTAAAQPPGPDWTVRPYRTFDDLHALMRSLVTDGGFDAVVHSAAVSDYHTAGVYAPAAGSRFDAAAAVWEGDPPRLVDRAAGKVKSDEPELWLRLVRAPKLIDLVRRDWGFRGVLVKFKLEVGISDDALLDVAERSRRASDADLMAANTLDGAAAWALLGPLSGNYERVPRSDLPRRLWDAVEALATAG